MYYKVNDILMNTVVMTPMILMEVTDNNYAGETVMQSVVTSINISSKHEVV